MSVNTIFNNSPQKIQPRLNQAEPDPHGARKPEIMRAGKDLFVRAQTREYTSWTRELADCRRFYFRVPFYPVLHQRHATRLQPPSVCANRNRRRGNPAREACEGFNAEPRMPGRNRSLLCLHGCTRRILPGRIPREGRSIHDARMPGGLWAHDAPLHEFQPPTAPPLVHVLPRRR